MDAALGFLSLGKPLVEVIADAGVVETDRRIDGRTRAEHDDQRDRRSDKHKSGHEPSPHVFLPGPRQQSWHCGIVSGKRWLDRPDGKWAPAFRQG